MNAREGAVKTQDRKMTTRVVLGKPADRSFDIDFWQQQGDEAIFSAAWDMVLMAEEFRHGRLAGKLKPRLSRLGAIRLPAHSGRAHAGGFYQR
jgi:hypothetical protein